MENALDVAVLRFFGALNPPAWLDGAILLWTDYIQQALMVLVIVLLFFRKTRKSALIALIALFLSTLTVEALWKNLFERVRPYDLYQWARLIGEPSPTFSFPSGHTSIAFAVAGGLWLGSPKWARNTLVCAAILTGFSRVYISIHYTTDVLAGAANGTLCAVAAYFVVKGLYALGRKRKEKKGPRSQET